MNHNAIIALAMPGTRTIRVTYPKRFNTAPGTPTEHKLYSFLCDIPDVKVGDYVIVGPTNAQDYPVTVMVREVDATPVLNFADPDKVYRWVWQKVDVAAGEEKAAKLKAIADQLAAVDYLVQQSAAMDRYLSILPKESAAYALMQAAKKNLEAQALGDSTAAYAVLAQSGGY